LSWPQLELQALPGLPVWQEPMELLAQELLMPMALRAALA
jgi:hypothetical protein